MRQMLEVEGYVDILEASSAAAAMSVLESAAAVDVILLDIEMDELDGISACCNIKALEAYQDLPIIMVTANNDPEMLKKAFEAGAMDYLCKPPTSLELGTRVGGALRLKREIDQRKAREEELEQLNIKLTSVNEMLRRMAVVDGLTGVANRRYFDEIIAEEWSRARRERASLALIMADVDHFKFYNDNYGHLLGDECLKKVAGAMQTSLDRAGDLLARYGGEEFAVILPGTDSIGAASVAEKIRAAVEDLELEHSGSPVAKHVTISMGVASIKPDGDNVANELIAIADKNLYQAKQDGRNRVAGASPSHAS